MKTTRRFGDTCAILGLSLLALGASAQTFSNPYQSFQSAPPFISLGYGAAPVAITPFGVQPYVFSGFDAPAFYGYAPNGTPTDMYGNPLGYNNGPTVINPQAAQNYPPGQDGNNPPTNATNPYNDVNTAPDRVVNQAASNILPRTSDTIEVRRLTNNQIQLSWDGEPRAVSRITFALLDKNRQPIQQRFITAPPATARLTRSTRAAYYRVVVEYVNGTTNTVTSPL